MFRTHNVAYAAAALCLCSCSSPDHEKGSIEEQASATFGLPVAQVESLVRKPRFERCYGKRALVVPPRGSIEIPVRRGSHTLSGEFSICDAIGAEPVEFRVELLATPTRVLLGQPAAVPELAPRLRYPFLVTFWVETDAPLLLQTVGKSPDVRTGWIDLALTSIVRPHTIADRSPTARPKPRDDTLPDHAIRPGMRRRNATAEPSLNGGIWLSDWGWNASSSSWGPIEIDQSNGAENAGDGTRLSINGRVYGKGVGMHPPGRIVVDLYRRCRKFTAEVGVDDAVGDAGSVRFFVYADGEPLFDSKLLTGRDDPVRVDVPLLGRSSMVLMVGNGDDGPDNDWANWAEARLFCDPL